MKKSGKRVLAILLACLLLWALAGCGGRCRIKLLTGEDLVTSCPKWADPGETVTVETVSVCDGEVCMSVNGSTAGIVRELESVFTFTMPEGTAEVKVWVVANGLA